MKNLPVDSGDSGLISGSVRSPGVGNDKMATHSSILAWEIPGTGAWWDHKESDTIKCARTHTHTHTHTHILFLWCK